jgi:hypothetical protein
MTETIVVVVSFKRDTSGKKWGGSRFTSLWSCYPFKIINDKTTYALSSIVPPWREVIREQLAEKYFKHACSDSLEILLYLDISCSCQLREYYVRSYYYKQTLS